jgi:hypothetical protein
MFADAPTRAGMYESFYLRAVAPDRPAGVWIRYTVHKRGGRVPTPPTGSVWCTVWEGPARPYMHKLTSEELSVPAGGWIAVGDSQMGPGEAVGACGEARWSLRFASAEPELRHLPHALLYRAPLPRTKLSSPMPAGRFEGVLELGGRTLALDGWRGMVGHNWGTQHAERWIWLHGVGFAEEPGAWIDVAIGRVRMAGVTSPWVANGALRIGGERLRLGGLGARGLLVAERPSHCVLSLPGTGGAVVEAHVQAPPAALAGWRYADPDGGGGDREDRDGLDGRGEDRDDRGDTRRAAAAQHDVSNCSIAALTLVVRRPGRAARTLRTAHGAAYELGMRERDHGVSIAPFGDG